ncbi:MAG TPA: hypothetical protein VES19_02060 [Candidatus Limnocylindrales bacterium]|nr:hypothetical protein [Candidatus Limnocylindrales bacterium]
MTDETPGATGLLLPVGARLLHVGPDTTGTTSLQAALWAARPAMLEQGVRHVGKNRNPAIAVRAVTGQSASASTEAAPSIRDWRDLVGEVRRASEPRAVLSGERFAWATPDVIERVANDLDAGRLHVAVTLRPLGRILPSQWQQSVLAGLRMSYGAWLREVFGTHDTTTHEVFWRLHRHDELVTRWADVLGRGRVTAIVVDERQHGKLLQVFEGLLGLREGTLEPDRDVANRAMTLGEIEAVRFFNLAAHAAGVDHGTHASMMRFGAAIHMQMRAPGADEARIQTPQWALDKALAADEAIVAALGQSGVRIIGDLASLAVPLTDRSGDTAAPDPVSAPPRVAAEMAMGMALASGLARRASGTALEAAAGDAGLARVSTWQLASVAGFRSLSAVRSGIGRAGRVAGRGRRRLVPAMAPATPPVSAAAPVTSVTAPAAAPQEPGQAKAAALVLPAALPDGTRILHIGPPKTGTTSLQAAFWAARAEALAQGVRYAGRTRHSTRAVWAVTGRRSFDEGRAVPPMDHWTELLTEIREAPEPRVVLSSEGFAFASPAASGRILADLDPARTHVVLTLRPLGRLLASEWQEHAQSGLEVPYDAWLHNLFHEPSLPMTGSFWRRQRHDTLIERWAGPVGAGNVTVVVVDDRDHDALLRVFEALCGLRLGTLVADRTTANRSLTLEEITAIRALRERWEAEGLSSASFQRIVRMKVAAEMKTRVPAPDELRIVTPQWALDRAAEIADEIVTGIAASGVRVIGDLEVLREVPRGYGDTQPEVRIPPAISASMAMGVLVASGATRRSGAAWIEPIETARLSTRRIARVVAGRAVSAAARRSPGPSSGGEG